MALARFEGKGYKRYVPSLVAGALCAFAFIVYALFYPIAVTANCNVIYYFDGVNAPAGTWHTYIDRITSLLYIIATIVPFFITRNKTVWLLGGLIAISYVVSYVAYFEAFASVWCFFAALISILVYGLVRDKSHRLWGFLVQDFFLIKRIEMQKYLKWLPLGGVLVVILFFGIWLTIRLKNVMSLRSQAASSAAYVSQIPKTYPTKSYAELIGRINGLTENQLKQHYDLYVGYVKKRNQIEQDLQTVDRTNSAGITYSPFRALKTAETFAVNGSLLHELYFENMSAVQTQPGPETMKLIVSSFGSLDNFKNDLIDLLRLHVVGLS